MFANFIGYPRFDHSELIGSIFQIIAFIDTPGINLVLIYVSNVAFVQSKRDMEMCK